MDGSERPVYKLAKVHTTERNLFELVVQVVFSDSEVSEQIKSNPFLIKTKRLNDEPLGMSTRNNVRPQLSQRNWCKMTRFYALVLNCSVTHLIKKSMIQMFFWEIRAPKYFRDHLIWTRKPSGIL